MVSRDHSVVLCDSVAGGSRYAPWRDGGARDAPYTSARTTLFKEEYASEKSVRER